MAAEPGNHNLRHSKTILMFSVSYKRSTVSPFCDQRLTHVSGNVQLLLHPGKKGPHDNVLIKFITTLW